MLKDEILCTLDFVISKITSVKRRNGDISASRDYKMGFRVYRDLATTIIQIITEREGGAYWLEIRRGRT